MGLSAEKKESLKALYEDWGTHKVRRDLQRHQYPSLLGTEVNAFERAWLNEKDARERRWDGFVTAIKIIFFSLLVGIATALFVL